VAAPLFDVLSPGGGAAVGIVFGLALVLLMFVMPGGFVAAMRRLRARIITVVPRPSWLAEVRPHGRDG
jgi:hypothetical protein